MNLLANLIAIIGGAHDELQKLSIEAVQFRDEYINSEDKKEYNNDSNQRSVYDTSLKKITNSVRSSVAKKVALPKPGVNCVAIRPDRKIFACASM
jgi:hypothetical protein